MKTLWRVIEVIILCLVIVLVVLRITGLEPKDRRPGLWLKGTLVTAPVTDWSFAEKIPVDQVQTRTWYLLPHSVNTNHMVFNGQLYITSAFPAGRPYPQGKSWTANVVRDPHVRLKLGDQLFDRVLVPVSDAEKASLLKGMPASTNGSTMYLFHAVPE